MLVHITVLKQSAKQWKQKIYRFFILAAGFWLKSTFIVFWPCFPQPSYSIRNVTFWLIFMVHPLCFLFYPSNLYSNQLYIIFPAPLKSFSTYWRYTNKIIIIIIIIQCNLRVNII